MKLLAFGASNSKASINQQLAKYAAHSIEEAEVTLVELGDYDMPLYGIDRETEDGIPAVAHDFKKVLRESDAVIISFAEHNGSYTVAFKNLMDWISRIKSDSIWEDKPAVLLATSPGARGAQSVLQHAADTLQYRGLMIKGTFSLPSFGQHFDAETGITAVDLDQQLKAELKKLQEA